uniref:Uncharacterized protein n=1 Tax=Pithovirus LCPAC101 TaxID=2506586 RepID=A0A481Z2Q4_9VIRU|nr:MAG: hypothetical protein LCPAC101_02980 [Pithovirus LCPAC101]
MYGGANSKYGSDDKGDFVVHFVEYFNNEFGFDARYIEQYTSKHNLSCSSWSAPTNALSELLKIMNLTKI